MNSEKHLVPLGGDAVMSLESGMVLAWQFCMGQDEGAIFYCLGGVLGPI